MKRRIEVEVSESAILKWIGTVGFGWIILILGLIFVGPFLFLESAPALLITGINGIVVLFLITVFSARVVRKEEK